LSATYHRLPSEIVGVDDAWAAYQLDVAVMEFGTWVESKLNERDAKGKPKTTLAKLLDDGSRPREYAPLNIDTASLRRVQVREDGTWED
jgi:hypothetical protein